MSAGLYKQNRNPILRQLFVACHQNQALHKRLGHKQPVERVTMVQREQSRLVSVPNGDRQLDQPKNSKH